MWSKIVDFVWNYGWDAVLWCYNNREWLLSMGTAVFDFLSKMFG